MNELPQEIKNKFVVEIRQNRCLQWYNANPKFQELPINHKFSYNTIIYTDNNGQKWETMSGRGTESEESIWLSTYDVLYRKMI